MLAFLNNYPLWLESIIIGSILMGIVIIFGILIPLFKPIIKKESMIYLYSFSTGYFIVLALFGLLRDALGNIDYGTRNMTPTIRSIIIISILSFGIIIGMSTGLLFRYLIIRKQPEIHDNHYGHSHSDVIFSSNEIDHPKSKWIGVLLLLSHRVVAGLTLGILVFNFKYKYEEHIDTFTIGVIIAFIFHLIPEVLIVYYRQREAGVKMWSAILNGIVFKFILIILIIIGAYLANILKVQYWIIPLLLSISAGAISFAALFEFIPEILHVESQSKKVWYLISITLIMSFAIAIALITIGA